MPDMHKVRSAKIISVIRITSVTGTGTEENPNRVITQYWSLDGELLATVDPVEEDRRETGERARSAHPYESGYGRAYEPQAACSSMNNC